MYKTLLCALCCLTPAKDPVKSHNKELKPTQTTPPLPKPNIVPQQPPASHTTPAATRYEYTPASPDYRSKWNDGQKMSPEEGRHW